MEKEMPRIVVRVDWYDGSITREEVTNADNFKYYFDIKKNGSYSAPKDWCTILESNIK